MSILTSPSAPPSEQESVMCWLCGQAPSCEGSTSWQSFTQRSYKDAGGLPFVLERVHCLPRHVHNSLRAPRGQEGSHP